MWERRVIEGGLLGLAAALIGGGWQVATRHATTSSIAPADLVWLRYGIPALVLLPLLWRTGLVPRGVPWRLIALIVAGAGLPFGLIAITGSRYAPTAHMGVLMAGASPLIAAALAAALWRARPGRLRMLGLAAMALGVGLLGARSFAEASLGEVWRGDVLFLIAAALWAGYTLGFRRTGLTPWQGAALVNGWSALLLLPSLAWRGGTGLFDVAIDELVVQALWQGVVAGLLGLWTISAAITRLGAARAAAFGALVPAVSALGGWLWLGEPLTPIDTLAVLAATLGVALASGVGDRPKAAAPGSAETG